VEETGSGGQAGLKCWDLTLATPEENLACDEVLLGLCDEATGGEALRFWEPTGYFVVLGYANRLTTEVNAPFCRANGIPILRRCSGGGTVLQGPGCLNYALVLRSDESGPLHSLTAANRFILERHRAVFASLLGAPVEMKGQTDLALGGLKFSGNAQRRKRRALLFHGSFLLDFDFGLMERALPMPSRQPDYRAHRAHADFLMNLRLPGEKIKEALRQAWHADGPLGALPAELIRRLAREKYASSGWNERF
jgi:lipoate-protein ligase A